MSAVHREKNYVPVGSVEGVDAELQHDVRIPHKSAIESRLSYFKVKAPPYYNMMSRCITLHRKQPYM